MNSTKKEIVNVISELPEIEKFLLPMGGEFMPGLKTIYNKPQFINWKERLRFQLQKLKREAIVIETLDLLDNGFTTGIKDEKSFNTLKSKLGIISDNLQDLLVQLPEGMKDVSTMRLSKGAIIQTAFDEYTLIKQVGSGGNGRVFSSTNQAGELCAIKFLERNIGGEKLKRFKNEINFCEQHHHKNIVPILDRGYAYLDEKDFVFYVMPLYKDTLKNKIKAGICPDDAVNIFIGILEGLKYAHEHDAIHRDIKPENILFADNSVEPIICDFGIAHFAEDDLLTAIETKPTDRMANFYYAAPEQYRRGIQACPQTDIYAAGLILNEMFTGEIPQAAGYRTITEVNVDYGYLDDVFVRLFRQEPKDRLYPEDSIISEMKLCAEKHNREKEKVRLQSIVNELITPGEFEATIVKKEYRDGELVFIFDKVLPEDWYQFIAFGSYTCSYMMGYGHERLRKNGPNELAMPLRKSESENDLKSIIENVGNWVHTANQTYNQEQKRKALAEQKRKETARKAEIERIEKEAAFSAMISNLL